MFWFLMYCAWSGLFFFVGAKGMSLHWFWNGVFSLLASGTFTYSIHRVLRSRLCPARLRRGIKSQWSPTRLRSRVEEAFGTTLDLKDPTDEWSAGIFACVPLLIVAYVYLGFVIQSGIWRFLCAFVVGIPLAVFVDKLVNAIAGEKRMVERAKQAITEHNPQIWKEMTHEWNDRKKRQAQALAVPEPSNEKVPCPKCGKMILKRLAVLNSGYCLECTTKSVFAPENFPPATCAEASDKTETHMLRCNNCGAVQRKEGLMSLFDGEGKAKTDWRAKGKHRLSALNLEFHSLEEVRQAARDKFVDQIPVDHSLIGYQCLTDMDALPFWIRVLYRPIDELAPSCAYCKKTVTPVHELLGDLHGANLASAIFQTVRILLPKVNSSDPYWLLDDIALHQQVQGGPMVCAMCYRIGCITCRLAGVWEAAMKEGGGMPLGSAPPYGASLNCRKCRGDLLFLTESRWQDGI